MTTFNDVFVAARDLSPSDRVRLIDAIWETVEPNQWSPPTDQWIEEVKRRSAEQDAGRMSASPASEVRERARRKAGLDG